MASMPYFHFSTTIYNFRERQTAENPSEDVLKKRRNFVETLSNAADIFEPHWGFGRQIGIAIGDHETIDELATRTRPPLYEYNVFRNETVEAIGRDAMVSAPAWYTEELSS
jgi:hypothetical protein